MTYIIAEAGVNHNGSLDIAKKLIKAAKKANADAIKFQYFNVENLVKKNAEKAPYQKKNDIKKNTQYQMLKKYEFGIDKFKVLKNFSKKLNIDFILSPFDLSAMYQMKKFLNPKIIKIASGEITNFQLLSELNIDKEKIILSTGMSNIKEIVDACNIIAKKKFLEFKNKKIIIRNQKIFNKIKKKLTILHCVSSYPASDQFLNLNAITMMKKNLRLNIGFSDHSEDIFASIIAVSKGAKIIEKHITLNRNMKGPDHKASVEPKVFLKMVKSIKRTNKILGNPIKKIQNSEIQNLKPARKSIYAKKNILKNEKFTKENLIVQRPFVGICASKYFELIGTKSKKVYKPGQIIKLVR